MTPNKIAATFARLLGHPVRMEAVPRGSWEVLFKSQGMKNPITRIRILDGFNEGWIDFENGESRSLKGDVTLETVLNALIKRWIDVRALSRFIGQRGQREYLKRLRSEFEEVRF